MLIGRRERRGLVSWEGRSEGGGCLRDKERRIERRFWFWRGGDLRFLRLEKRELERKEGGKKERKPNPNQKQYHLTKLKGTLHSKEFITIKLL